MRDRKKCLAGVVGLVEGVREKGSVEDPVGCIYATTYNTLEQDAVGSKLDDREHLH